MDVSRTIRSQPAPGAELDGVTDRLIHRRCSRRMVPVLERLGLTPNQVTLIGLGLGLVSAWALWGATAHSAILGLVAYAAAAIADHADGDLARGTGRQSRLGQWLDLGADTMTNALVAMAMAATASRVAGGRAMLVGLAAVTGIVASTIVVHSLPSPLRAGRLVHGLLRLANRDALYLALVTFVLLRWRAEWLLPGLVWVLAAGSNAYWVGFLLQRKRGRHVRAPRWESSGALSGALGQSHAAGERLLERDREPQ